MSEGTPFLTVQGLDLAVISAKIGDFEQRGHESLLPR